MGIEHAYAQHDFFQDKRSIDAVGAHLDEVWPTLTSPKVFDDKWGWPYEVEADGRKKGSNFYSLSTNAMILYAIAAALNRVKNNPFDIDGHKKIKPPKDETNLHKRLQESWNQLQKELLENEGAIKSRTFGENDPFTLSWIAALITEFEQKSSGNSSSESKELKTKIANLAVAALKERIIGAALLKLDPQTATANDHVFPELKTVQLIVVMRSPFFNDVNIVEENLSAFEKFLTKLRARLLGRIHEQLSLWEISHSAFDSSELIFSLEAIQLIDKDPRLIDKDLLGRVCHVMKQGQEKCPYWRPIKPFITTPQGMGLLPLSVEVATSFLRIISRLDSDEQVDYFAQTIDMFRRYTTWLFTRITRLGNNPQFMGWHSEHVFGTQTIHTWETAQVALFLMHYREMVERHISRTLLIESNFTQQSPKQESEKMQEANGDLSAYWQKVWGNTEPLKVHPVLHGIGLDFVTPRDRKATSQSNQPLFSLLLYGPPGTAKSTLAEKLAESLNWKLITITPSDFLSGGSEGVEMRAKEIFQTLCEQRNAVVLFDEIDRLILDRDSQLYRSQQDVFQFMTPSMLVKLRDLRKAEKCIFVVATNYEETIDPAAKRHGRIDQKCLILPPGYETRKFIIKILTKKTLKHTTDMDTQQIEKFVDEVSKSPEFKSALEKSRLSVYNELEASVRQAMNKFRITKPQPTPQEFVSILANNMIAPSINLLSYRGRFNINQSEGQKFQAAQEPYFEFLMLVYLKIEEGGVLTSQERLLYTEVVNHGAGDKNSKELKEDTKNFIKERTKDAQASVSASLLQAIDS